MTRALLFLTVILTSTIFAFGQNTLSGRITDNEGGPLPYASIVVTHSIENGAEVSLKAQKGTITDLDGFYTLPAIPKGKFLVKVKYIGYEENSFQIDFTGGVSVLKKNVILKSGAVNLKEVAVTGQAKGQMSAINQQVNSLTIKNVVSADRIRQNPDANAAESIGRLPGVTVSRSGGEADGIVVRGMQGYNNVTINGVSVPVNLTSISQYALQNVEVFKSISADMDASAPAGTVNLKLGTAPDENSTSILAHTGYSDLNKTFKNYKFNISSNGRFFNKKLGLSANFSTEATDRSTEQLLADIGVGNQSVIEGQEIKLQTNGVRLRDVNRTIKRNSVILTTDYRFSPTASIEWSNIGTQSPGGPLNVDHTFSGGDGISSYFLEDNTGNKNYNYSSILTAKHLLGIIKVDYSAAFGYAHNNTKKRTTSFMNLKAYEQTVNIEQRQTLSHSEYIGLAQIENTTEAINKYPLTQSYQSQPGMAINKSESSDMNIDTRINMELPYSIGGFISGSIKWGGRYKHENHDQKTYGVNKGSLYFPQILMKNLLVKREDGSLWNDDINISPENYDQNGHILGSYLLDQSNYNDNFLNEGYNFGWYPNMGRVNEILDWYDNMTNYAFNRGQDYWQPIWGQIVALQSVDYNGNAAGTKGHIVNHYASYLMTVMKIGRNLNFVPGLRYEKSHYDMNAWNIRNESISILQLTGEPVKASHDDEFFLPMVQLKYEPLKWLQVLGSYTQTLKRPDVEQLDPWVNEDKMGNGYSSGNPNLKPEQWTGIDFGVAAHSRKIGLFSVNLFYKKVKDKIANSHWTKMSIDTVTRLGSFQPDQRVDVTEIQNHPYEGIAKGIEVEWQTNFWYLPKPFNKLTLNLNYSYINNKTTYVYTATRDSLIGYGRGNRPIYEQLRYDQLVVGPMTNQPSHLFNASLGYAYKNFETYLSYQYIGEIFLQKSVIVETDPFKTAFHRVDLQAKYKLPVKGLELMLNMANLTDTKEVKKLRGDARPTSIERYGMTADLALRFTF